MSVNTDPADYADTTIQIHGDDALDYCERQRRYYEERGAELAACWWECLAGHVKARITSRREGERVNRIESRVRRPAGVM